jgi:DNA-binding transcriptional ArsR family regulator
MANETNTALLTALGNPQRRRILQEVRRHPGGISPSEVAEAIREPLQNIGYHCRVLRDCGAVELVNQKQVRGAIKSFYRFAVTDRWALEVLDQDKGGEEAAPGS